VQGLTQILNVRLDGGPIVTRMLPKKTLPAPIFVISIWQA
jgi:hypothetical protein